MKLTALAGKMAEASRSPQGERGLKPEESKMAQIIEHVAPRKGSVG